MESKNVLFAIILSSLVLFLWATFFEPPVVDKQVTKNEINKNQNTPTPSVEEEKPETEILRSDSINSTKRIKIENANIKGSISLQGGIIDDIIFKNYKENLNSENNVAFLNPKNSSNEYFIETGWAAGGNEKINLPLDSTIWNIKGNNVLRPNNPIILEWNNNEGLIFTKKIELDDKFLFKIRQEVKNSSNNSCQFCPYA